MTSLGSVVMVAISVIMVTVSSVVVAISVVMVSVIVLMSVLAVLPVAVPVKSSHTNLNWSSQKTESTPDLRKSALILTERNVI
jgi:hypothetical protein